MINLGVSIFKISILINLIVYIEFYVENTEASLCQVRKIFDYMVATMRWLLPHSLRSYFVFAISLNGGRFLVDLMADPAGKGISRCGPLDPFPGILSKILNFSLFKTPSSGKI